MHSKANKTREKCRILCCVCWYVVHTWHIEYPVMCVTIWYFAICSFIHTKVVAGYLFCFFFIAPVLYLALIINMVEIWPPNHSLNAPYILRQRVELADGFLYQAVADPVTSLSLLLPSYCKYHISSYTYFPPLNIFRTLVRKLFKFSLHERKTNTEINWIFQGFTISNKNSCRGNYIRIYNNRAGNSKSLVK